MLHLLHCPLLSLSRGQVPLHLGEAKPPRHCMQHQPRTWAKRGTDKSTAQVGFGQSRQGSQTHTNAESFLLLSPSLSHSSCLQDGSSLMPFLSPNLGVAPCLSPQPCQTRAIMHPPTTSLEPLTPALPVPPHPAASAAIYSPTTPHGAWHGLPIPGHLGCWSLSVLLQNPHRWLNNAWAVISSWQFTLFFLQV